MFRQIAMFIILAVTFVASGLLAEAVKQVPKPLGFAFHRDQSVYIAAFHYEDNHRKYGADRTGIGDYLAAEQLVRKEFEKSGIFKPVDKPSNADYVFVVYVHDNAAEGIAVAPEKYSQTKADLFKGDLDPLRDAAYARYLVGPFKLPTLGRMSAQLVKKFHDEAMRNK